MALWVPGVNLLAHACRDIKNQIDWEMVGL